MSYIRCFILLLPLLSCVTIPNNKQGVIILENNETRVPLFIERIEPIIDDSPFVINIPDADYNINSINKRVDSINVFHVLSTGKGSVISATAIGGNIFFLNDAGALFCVDSAGEKIWHKFIAEGNGYGTISNVGGVLIVATGTTRLYGVNPENGDVIWKKALKAPVHSGSVAVGREKFAIITIDNYLYVLNAHDGALRWSYQAVSPMLKKVNFSTPVYYDGKIILPPIENELMALDAKNGSKLWSKDIDITYKASIFYSVDDSPIIIDGVVIASNNMGKVEAFEVNSGEKKWEQYISFKGNAYVVNNMLFTLTEDNQLIALNSDGKIKWVSSLEDGASFYGPILINGSLWLFSNKGNAFEYDVKNGDRISEVTIPGNLSYSPFAVNGMLYSFTKDRKLVIIGDKNSNV